MKKYNRDELVFLLTGGVVSIVFEKKDGTIREMACTLDDTIIPSDALPKGDSVRKQSDSVLAVFDVEVGEWRSFRIDSLKYVK